jgi:alanine-glyoxylate transaminase/serine-glyoxylate transaminase/serine-pyruvate transaminase
LTTLGLEPFAQEGHRLWQLNAVRVPEGIDDLEVRTRLLRRYDTEIGGGLGPVKGKIWRIGTMGYSADRPNILNLLSALEDILDDLNYKVEKGAARDAAEDVYDAHESSTRLDDSEGQGETIGAESVAQGVAHKD